LLLFRSPRAIAAEGEEEGNTAMRAKDMKRPNAASRRRAATRRIAFVSLPPFLPAYSFSFQSQARDLFDVR